jgi:5-methyltetrahydrofolate--homocysteine methyltransferase
MNLRGLKKAVSEGNDELAVSLAQKALEAGVQPAAIIHDGLVLGIQEAGELWNNNVYFWPDVVMSTEAFRMAIEIIEPHLSAGQLGTAGNVVIGTVAGDMHNLGKKIVIDILRCANFDVIDLGEDVPVATFIDKVKAIKPDILGLGCYMTTTMPEMANIITELGHSGLRSSVKVIVGGVPISQESADEIGADAWGKDAFDTVKKAEQLVKQAGVRNE